MRSWYVCDEAYKNQSLDVVRGTSSDNRSLRHFDTREPMQRLLDWAD